VVARIRARLAREDGMTLIELLITLTILAIVLSAIVGVFVSSLHSETDMNYRFQAQQDARLALTSMRQDVRTACSATVSTKVVSNDTVELGFCSDSSTTLSATPVSFVTWCTRDEGGHYGLFRESVDDPSCATGSTGIRKADLLKTGSVFGPLATNLGPRPELPVDLQVDASTSTYGGLYRLSDTILLRNWPTYTLSVSKAGSGSGTVTSSPTGIACGSTCSYAYWTGTQVTLSAAPDSGSTFTGWSGGGCSGTGTCAVTMSAADSVTATFDPAAP
jgi:prepilin-type N-terminal cleavage/methylation domain-containing protein